MRTVQEIVAEINAKKIRSPHCVEDVLDLTGLEEVATVNLDERRWYVLGTVVFKLGDGFFGVRGPTSLKSETMDWEDVGATCEAFEMEQVPSVTYKRKSVA
jgi:hypothetical protein